MEEVKEDPKASDAAGYAEALSIFAKYEADKYIFTVCAEHDQIWACLTCYDSETSDVLEPKMTPEDELRLEQLGWWRDESREMWSRFV